MVDIRRNIGIPSGVVFPFAGTTAPYGYLICDGRAVSRTDYADLFLMIGTTYGIGDGSTTFNLPDYRGRFLRGVDGTAGNDPDKASRTAMNTGGNTGNAVGSVQDDTLQQMSGSFGIGSADGVQMARAYGGVFQQLTNGANTPAAQYDGNPSWSTQIEFNASLVARTSSETRPKNANVNYIIKI